MDIYCKNCYSSNIETFIKNIKWVAKISHKFLVLTQIKVIVLALSISIYDFKNSFKNFEMKWKSKSPFPRSSSLLTCCCKNNGITNSLLFTCRCKNNGVTNSLKQKNEKSMQNSFIWYNKGEEKDRWKINWSAHTKHIPPFNSNNASHDKGHVRHLLMRLNVHINDG